MLKVTLIVGLPGTGKSRLAHLLAEGTGKVTVTEFYFTPVTIGPLKPNCLIVENVSNTMLTSNKLKMILTSGVLRYRQAYGSPITEVLAPKIIFTFQGKLSDLPEEVRDGRRFEIIDLNK